MRSKTLKKYIVYICRYEQGYLKTLKEKTLVSSIDMNKRDLKTLKEKTLVSSIDMNKRDLKTLKEKTLVSSIDMDKRDLKKLTKAQLIRLLLKQQAQKPSNSVKQMVNGHEDIIQPPNNSEIHTSQFHHRQLENGKA